MSNGIVEFGSHEFFQNPYSYFAGLQEQYPVFLLTMDENKNSRQSKRTRNDLHYLNG